MDPNTWMPVMMGGGMLMMLLPVIILVLVVVILVWVARAMTRRSDIRSQTAGEGPLVILQRRYANGDINDEEYERKRHALIEQR